MQFSTILTSIRAHDAGWIAEVGADWTQGRAIFGGMMAALGSETMRRLIPPERALQALDVTFVGPGTPGQLRIEAKILRIGKSVTTAFAQVWSGDHIATTMTGVYGAPRPSAVAVAPAASSSARRVDDLTDSTVPPGFAGPAFLEHFAIRWAEGARPGAGVALSRSKAYIRHRDTATFTESHLVALIDCIPSPLLQMLSTLTPASSLTWNLQFLHHDHRFMSNEWWRIDTQIDAAADGYSCQSSAIFDPYGKAVALSRQLVTVFG